MIKLFAVVIVALLTVIILKNENRHFALIITICVVFYIFFISIENIQTVFSKLFSFADDLGYMGSYITMMIKILGITIATQFTSDLCRDCGENAIATQTELFSKIAILVITLPLFETLINIVTGLLK